MSNSNSSVGLTRRIGTKSQGSVSPTGTSIATATATAVDPMKGALLDSRHRWRDLALLGADLAFETDRRGRFTLLAPEVILGWSADHLLGRPAITLLSQAKLDGGFNPFRPVVPARGRRAWLKRADGSAACMTFAVAPIRDVQGRVVGARGLGVDMTEQEHGDEASATRLRRCEVIDYILKQLRQEVLAPRMMQAALQALAGALGAEGAGVLDVAEDGQPALRHAVGRLVPDIALTARELMANQCPDAELAQGVAADGRKLLACGCETRFGQRTAVVLWREPGSRAWDRDDMTLVVSASGIARVILEHESIEHEMALQARTDPLTGLLNRRAFQEDVTRRIARLDRDGLPGTVMFVDLDNFKRVNDTLGHAAGDEALCIVARLLQAAVRPGDLVARFGGDEFAVWLDATEEFSASERAELLRVEVPAATAHLSGLADDTQPLPPLTLSIGIATRWPSRAESLESLMHRADQAMYEVKHSGRASWRVSHAETW